MSRSSGGVAALSLAGNAYQAWKNNELQLLNQALQAANGQLRGQMNSLQQTVDQLQRQIVSLRAENEQLRRNQLEGVRK